MSDERATATLGGGCFWCVEAVFDQLEGVESTVSGYAGGSVSNPTYEEVCTGTTGHAEVVQITYDPGTVGYVDILEVFFATHDPTTRNRQGPDVGEQYRSIVLHHDEEQRREAETYIEALEASGAYDDPIVTDVEPLDTFYPAEDDHQNYFERHPERAYCQRIVAPKVEKVRSKFEELLAT